jgi:hypothetical protein
MAHHHGQAGQPVEPARGERQTRVERTDGQHLVGLEELAACQQATQRGRLQGLVDVGAHQRVEQHPGEVEGLSVGERPPYPRAPGRLGRGQQDQEGRDDQRQPEVVGPEGEGRHRHRGDQHVDLVLGVTRPPQVVAQTLEQEPAAGDEHRRGQGHARQRLPHRTARGLERGLRTGRRRRTHGRAGQRRHESALPLASLSTRPNGSWCRRTAAPAASRNYPMSARHPRTVRQDRRAAGRSLRRPPVGVRHGRPRASSPCRPAR